MEKGSVQKLKMERPHRENAGLSDGGPVCLTKVLTVPDLRLSHNSGWSFHYYAWAAINSIANDQQ